MVDGHREPLALDALGWRQFLDLCIAVVELEVGVNPGSWVGGDGRCCRVSLGSGLTLPGAPPRPGPCWVEAFWTSDRGTSSRAAALGRKMGELRGRLAAEEWNGSIALLTNYVGVFADDALLHVTLKSDHIALLGPRWLSERVDQSPSLRRSMPSLLSLDDLGRWVAPEVGERSTLDLAPARALAGVFVPTRAHRRALRVLDAHHFAVLTGPPEMGKTSIARMIAVAQMSSGWDAFECTHPQDIHRAFEPTRCQVFVADDAFGSTEYRPDAAERWAREMEELLRMMDERHLLIWTSRPAPLRAGLRRIHRERGAERFPQPGEVLVDAGDLSLDEKVLILLRHAKATVPEEMRVRFREGGYTIVSHPHFTPERIRRLVASDSVKLPPHVVAVSAASFDALVEWHIQTPTRDMTASFNALSEEHRALLIAMLDAPPGPIEERELAHLARLHRPEGLSRAPMELVDRLTDHFLRVTDTLKIDWVHPSWRDLVIDHLREHGTPREAFLERCTLDGVLLALAGAGGSTGARRLALLVTDRDWDLVADGVARTIRQRSDSDVVRVLDALAAASNEPSADARDFRELSALIAAALAATAQRCERGAAPIDVELIGAFSRLTGKVLDPPSLPCLDRTWTELLPGPMDLDSPSGVDSAVRWLQLGEILREHAPDRARRYGFPTQHRARIYALVDGANRLLACSGTGAQHGQLLDLLRLCRRAVAGEPARVPGLDEAIWQANRMTETEQPASSLLFPEWSVRQHVELILEDL